MPLEGVSGARDLRSLTSGTAPASLLWRVSFNLLRFFIFLLNPLLARVFPLAVWVPHLPHHPEGLPETLSLPPPALFSQSN